METLEEGQKYYNEKASSRTFILLVTVVKMSDSVLETYKVGQTITWGFGSSFACVAFPYCIGDMRPTLMADWSLFRTTPSYF